MRITFFFLVIAVILTACSSDKIDLKNDDDVKSALNTTERDGSFIYSSKEKAKHEFKIHLTFSGDTMTTTHFHEGKQTRVDKHGYSLGKAGYNGRTIDVHQCYGDYYLSNRNLIIHMDKNNIHHYTFVED